MPRTMRVKVALENRDSLDCVSEEHLLENVQLHLIEVIHQILDNGRDIAADF